MAKKPPLKKDEKLPPHPLSGYYVDKTGGRFVVPSKPTFALFRCNSEWQPLDEDSPIQDDVPHFERALRFNTFTKINP